MYRYDTTFAFPVRGVPQTYKAYDAEMVIRNASDGKKYLYDIVAIKENTGLALDLSEKARGRLKAAMQSDASTNSISTSNGNVNAKFSMKGMDSAYLAAVERGDTEAAQNAKTAAGEGSGEGRFSIKRTSQMTLAQQLKMYYDGKMASSDAFYFGETPDVLKKDGFNALPLAMTTTDFKKSTKQKHNIPRRVLKTLIEKLSHPLFSFSDGTRSGFVFDDIDGDGFKLLAALERGTNMDRKPVNVIQSLYGLEHPAEWIKNQIAEGKKFTLYDKEKANAFLQTYGYSALVGDGIRSTDAIVEDSQSDVKGKFSLKGMDSAGRQLL